MWGRRKKNVGAKPPHERNRRASLVGLLFAALAAVVSAIGAAGLTPDVKIMTVLVIASVLAVIVESGGLVWARSARMREDRSAVRLMQVLLSIAIIYTAGMQLNFFGALFLKAFATDQASSGVLTEIDGRIATLEKRRTTHPTVPGTVISLSWLIGELKKDKTPQGKIKHRQAQEDLATVQSLEKLDADIRAAHTDRVTALGKPPSDTKAEIVHMLTGWDKKTVPLFFALLSMLLFQFGQVCLPVIAGRGSPATARETPKPVSDDKGRNTGGTSSGSAETPQETGNVRPFPVRNVAARGNGADAGAHATLRYPQERVTAGNTPTVTHESPPEPAEWPPEAIDLVTRPTFRELLERPVTRPDGRETGNVRCPKEPGRDKKLRKRQSFEELYATTTDIVTRNKGIMPDARALRKLLAPCQMRRALDVREAWLADDERSRGVNKPPRARHRGKRVTLGRGLEDMMSAGTA